MTTEAPLPATSASPTARQILTRGRGIAIALLLLLAGAIAIAVVRSGDRHGTLDPRSVDPQGSRAVAALLDERGVSTRVITTLDEARAATGPDTTLLVAAPDLLTAHQQRQLHEATADSGGRTLLVAPGVTSVETLAPGVTADPANSAHSTLEPACDLPAARRAGNADTGGIRYTTTRLDADECYPSRRLATLLRLPPPQAETPSSWARPTSSSTTASTSTATPRSPFNSSAPAPPSGLVPPLPVRHHRHRSRRRTGPPGPAAVGLAVGNPATLHRRSRSRPVAGTPTRPPRPRKKLPVAIRASETAEGRARLYRKANARDRAATALRSTTRTRLAPLVGVPASQAHTPEVLLPALSAHLHGDGQHLHTLLFGPPPHDDTALITLADQLDALEREVRRP
ncbi:hypothetical protein GCM10020256_47180 [Streptomyces thermocoprophilus]